MGVKSRFEIQSHVDTHIATKISAQQICKPQPRREHSTYNQDESQEGIVFVGIYVIDQNFGDVRSWDLQKHDHDTHEEGLKDKPPVRPEHFDDFEYLTHLQFPVCTVSRGSSNR